MPLDLPSNSLLSEDPASFVAFVPLPFDASISGFAHDPRKEGYQVLSTHEILLGEYSGENREGHP
jgi:hypothetical protein